VRLESLIGIRFSRCRELVELDVLVIFLIIWIEWGEVRSVGE